MGNSLQIDRIHRALLKTIQNGCFLQGEKLPPVHKLAKELGTSHVTILRAMDQLEKHGFVTRIMGKGIFVGKPKEPDPVRPFKSKAESIADQIASAMAKDRRENVPIWPDNKLPSLTKLSKMFRTSRVTLLRALDKLEKQGLITRIMGKGVFAAKGVQSGTVLPRLESFEPKADIIAGQITSDIATGALRSGDFLPVRKFLLHQYRTSPRTLKHAIQSIVKKGIIHRKGSGYVVGAVQGHAPHGPKSLHKVCVFTQGEIGHWVFKRRFRSFVRAVEDELSQHRVHVHYLNFSAAHIRMFASIHEPEVTGFVYMERKPEPGKAPHGFNQKKLESELQYLARLKKPVVWFNFSTNIHMPESFAKWRSKQIYPFRIDFLGKKPGQELGTYLGLNGHHNIAFVSAITDNWCESRLDGLCRGLTTVAGNRSRVTRYVAETKQTAGLHHLIQQAEMLKVADEKLQMFFRGRTAEANNADIYHDIAVAAGGNLLAENYFRILPPLLEKVLANKEITAWVCADGLMASVAAAYLREKGKRIPEDVSIAGIEDSNFSLLQSVNTYDFQLGRAGYLSAHAILGDIPIKRNRKGVVDVPGRIIERGSVRRMEYPSSLRYAVT